MSSRTTFTKFVADHKRVQIPVIQRDYAQGRSDQKEVRNEFLKALHSALLLPPNDPSLPLDLDFVYGSVVGEGFQPLDGQQRLTTLFLLHWYLAWVDGKIEDFRERMVEGGKSRFGYQVRPSSKDFVDALAQFDPGHFSFDCNIVNLIEDQPWYSRSWQFDQTVRASVSMLGAIHEVFGTSNRLYDRLIDEERPTIAFQLLDLQHFDLSDELYIKMNARGKALTSFETFKARFEQHLNEHFGSHQLSISAPLSPAAFFAQRMDKQWADFFWSFKDDATATFDYAVMNVLRVLILITRDPEAIETTNANIADLRGTLQSTFSAFNEKGWLDENFLIAMFSLLENWSCRDGGLKSPRPNDRSVDLLDISKHVIRDPARLTFQDLALFAAYVQYIVASKDEIDDEAFSDWMRVVSNLAINTDYNRPDDLRRSLSGLADLKLWMAEIKDFLVQPNADIRGFSQLQVAEERLKSQLINLGEGWPERIIRAEQHRYLKGQIGFLLKFTELDLEDVDSELGLLDLDRANAIEPKFEHYLACVTQMLQDLEGGGAEGRTWELALMAVGDILLPVGRNFALPSLKEGPASWKRLLRLAAEGEAQGEVLKDLWDRIDDVSNAQAILKQVIVTEPNVEDWRRAIIDTPKIYEYCSERMIRFNDEGIYLLKRTQMNGAHAELYSYCLYIDLLTTSALKYLTPEYYESWSAEEPSLGLNVIVDELEHTFLVSSRQNGKTYYVWLHEPKEPAKPMVDFLALHNFILEEDFWTVTADRTGLKTLVQDLDRTLGERFDKPIDL